MAEPTGAARPTQDERPVARRRSRAAPVRTGVLVAVVFVVGLLAGAMTVAVLDDEPVVVETAAAPEAGEGAAGPSFSPGDASAEFVVSGACLTAVNAAQDTLLVVDDLGEAAAELDAARLDEIVRQLMPLETRLQRGLEACRLATEVDPGGQQPAGSPPPPSTTPAPAEGSGD
jgi:hypothetical protein